MRMLWSQISTDNQGAVISNRPGEYHGRLRIHAGWQNWEMVLSYLNVLISSVEKNDDGPQFFSNR